MTNLSDRGGRKIGVFGRFFKPDIEKMERKGDVEGLIKALEHKDVEVREKTAIALGRIKDARALPILITMLGSEDQKISAKGLKEFGDLAVEPIVETLLTKADFPWSAATYALVVMNDAEAVKGLIRAFRYAKDRIDYDNWSWGPGPYASRCEVAFSSLVKVKPHRIIEAIGPKKTLELVIEMNNGKLKGALYHSYGVYDQASKYRKEQVLDAHTKRMVPIVSYVFEKHAVSCPPKLLVEALVEFKLLDSIVQDEDALKVLAKLGASPHLVTKLDKRGEFTSVSDALLKIANSDDETKKKIMECILNLEGFEESVEARYVLAKLGDKRAFESLLTYVPKGLERTRQMEKSAVHIARIEEALIALSHQSALTEEAVKLAIKAVTYEREIACARNDRDSLHHSKDSLKAVVSLCRLRTPAISNILYKITQIPDREYSLPSEYYHMGFGDTAMLSFEQHRKIASEELVRRGFSTYDPSNYFTT